MDEASSSDVEGPLLDDPKVSSVLGVKGSLRFRRHGLRQKPHVILRRVELSKASDNNGEAKKLVYFSLFAQKRIEVKPGKEILLCVAAADGTIIDQPVIFEGDLAEPCQPDVAAGEEFITPKPAAIPPKMRRAWTKRVDEQKQKESKEPSVVTIDRPSIGVQTSFPQVSTAVQVAPAQRSTSVQVDSPIASVSTETRHSSSIRHTRFPILGEVDGPTLAQMLKHEEDCWNKVLACTSVLNAQFSDKSTPVLRSPPTSDAELSDYEESHRSLSPMEIGSPTSTPPHSPVLQGCAATASLSSVTSIPALSRGTSETSLVHDFESPSTSQGPLLSQPSPLRSSVQDHGNSYADVKIVSSPLSPSEVPSLYDESSSVGQMPVQGCVTPAKDEICKARKTLMPNPFVSGGFMTEFVGVDTHSLKGPDVIKVEPSEEKRSQDSPNIVPSPEASKQTGIRIPLDYPSDPTNLGQPASQVHPHPGPSTTIPADDRPRSPAKSPQAPKPKSKGRRHSRARPPARPAGLSAANSIPLRPPADAGAPLYPLLAEPGGSPPASAAHHANGALPAPPPPPPPFSSDPKLLAQFASHVASHLSKQVPPAKTPIRAADNTSYNVLPATTAAAGSSLSPLPSFPGTSTPPILKPSDQPQPSPPGADGALPPSLQWIAAPPRAPPSTDRRLSFPNTIEVNRSAANPFTARHSNSKPRFLEQRFSPAPMTVLSAPWVRTSAADDGAAFATRVFPTGSRSTFPPAGAGAGTHGSPDDARPAAATRIKREASADVPPADLHPPRKRQHRWQTREMFFAASLQGGADARPRAIVINSTAKCFAVSCDDRTVRIWNNEGQKKEIARLAHRSPIVSLSWIEGDAGIIALCEDGNISQWTKDAQNRWQCASLLHTGLGGRPDDEPMCLAYVRDRVAVSSPNFGVKVWIRMKGAWQSQRAILRQNVTTIKFVEEGDALLGGTKDGVLWYCQIPNGTLRAYTFLKAKISAIAVSPSGAHALVTQAGGRAHLVGLGRDALGQVQGKIERVFAAAAAGEQQDGAAAAACGAVFAARGDAVVAGCAEGCALVWDRAAGDVLCALDHGEDSVVRAMDSFHATPLDSQPACVITGTQRGALCWWSTPATVTTGR